MKKLFRCLIPLFVLVLLLGDTVPAFASDGVYFKDVPEGHSFYNAVYWAAEKNITAGYTSGSRKGTFGVGEDVERGQVVTFLWRMAKKPSPKNTSEQVFSDVPTNHPYYKAIQWAYEKEIAAGFKDGSFGVKDPCTRGQIVTFLWRYKGKPKAKSGAKTFSDVPSSHAFYGPVMWASSNGIAAGFKNGTFGVTKRCTRGQMVTFLYRMAGKPGLKQEHRFDYGIYESTLSKENSDYKNDPEYGVNGAYHNFTEYTMYDITGDGIKDMIIHQQNDKHAYVWKIYSADTGKVKLLKTLYTDFGDAYAYGRGFVTTYYYKGTQSTFVVTWNGKSIDVDEHRDGGSERSISDLPYINNSRLGEVLLMTDTGDDWQLYG